MKKYTKQKDKATEFEIIINENTNANIPICDDNMDYIEYLKWEKAGGKPTLKETVRAQE